QAVPDGHLARSRSCCSARYEERRDAARAALLENQGILGNAVEAANARADQYAGGVTLFRRDRLPARIGKRLIGGGNAVGDEIADLALLLGIQKIIRIEGAVAAVAARHDAGNPRWKVIGLEGFDPAAGTPSGQQMGPGMLYPNAEGRDK